MRFRHDWGRDACRLYLKKAEVVDVPRPGICSLVLLESGEGVADVDQECLETIVPKQEGSRVLILKGGSPCHWSSAGPVEATIFASADLQAEAGLDSVGRTVFSASLGRASWEALSPWM